MSRHTISGRAKALERDRKYRQAHKGQRAAYHAEYRRLNLDKERERDRNYVNAKRAKERERLRALPHETIAIERDGSWFWECSCGRSGSRPQKSEAKAVYCGELHVTRLG